MLILTCLSLCSKLCLVDIWVLSRCLDPISWLQYGQEKLSPTMWLPSIWSLTWHFCLKHLLHWLHCQGLVFPFTGSNIMNGSINSSNSKIKMEEIINPSIKKNLCPLTDKLDVELPCFTLCGCLSDQRLEFTLYPNIFLQMTAQNC